MNRHIFQVCAGLTAAALLLPVLPAHSQALPPPPPPIGPGANAPQNTDPPQVQFPQENPALNPTLPPVSAAPVLIRIDAAAKRHDISPLIYCVSTANPAQLTALNTTLDTRQVGPGLLNFPAVQPSFLSRVFSPDTSPDTQALRNQSTRLLWDSRYYGAKSRVTGNPAAIIPLLRSRLSAYPAGTKAGITNYSWGAENAIGGATAQADVLGIFGRESLDIATRTAPAPATPTFKAMQMYRNYDGRNAAFGSLSVSDLVPNSDELSSFASVRRSDGALTVMVINKAAGGPTPVSLSVSHFAGTTAQRWQLTSANTITHLPNAPLRGGSLTTDLPAQSITLFVVPAQKGR